MKILLVHNYYGSSAPSGENVVFESEKRLLIENGETVVTHTTSSDGLRKAGALGSLVGGLVTPWNPVALADVRRTLRSEAPDIMHVHNTFPTLSPAIFYAAREVQTATVLTLHNYRLFCSAGIPMRHGRPCTECMTRKSVIPALKYGCYRNSRVATLPLAFSIELHRSLHTWSREVDAFITLTEFQRGLVIDAGLPAEKVHVKPNVTSPVVAPVPWPQREEKAIFVGRVSTEKGVHILLESWRLWGSSAPRLEIVGDGPDLAQLRYWAKQHLYDTVTFAGQLTCADAQSRLASAKLLILPSLWFEGFPMVLLEALARGVPVMASRLGAMPCLISEGMEGALFNPGDSNDLCRVVKSVWGKSGQLEAMAMTARRSFECRYGSAETYKTLMQIYGMAAAERAKRLAE